MSVPALMIKAPASPVVELVRNGVFLDVVVKSPGITLTGAGVHAVDTLVPVYFKPSSKPVRDMKVGRYHILMWLPTVSVSDVTGIALADPSYNLHKPSSGSKPSLILNVTASGPTVLSGKIGTLAVLTVFPATADNFKG